MNFSISQGTENIIIGKGLGSFFRKNICQLGEICKYEYGFYVKRLT